MRRIAVLSIALLVLTTLLVPQRSKSADKPDKPMPADQHFRGKYIAITNKMAGKLGGALLKNVTVKQLGSRTFLVGEYAAEIGEAYEAWKGVRTWVPVEEIITLLEFDDIEQARKLNPGGRPQEAAAKDS
jgi:hypothetical protein